MKKISILLLVIILSSSILYAQNKDEKVLYSGGIHLTADPMAIPITVGFSKSSDMGLVFSWNTRPNCFFIIFSGEIWMRPEPEIRMMPFAISPRLQLSEFNFLRTKQRIYFEPYAGYSYNVGQDKWSPAFGANLVLDLVNW